MASIRKIALTPLKWASKKVVKGTLLRFPGGEEQPNVACVYCPEMCRFSCPTAVASGNDAVTPSKKNGLLYKEQKWPGRASGGGPLWTIYDCTGCGRCTEYCVYEMPVADRLFEARPAHEWERAKRAAESLSDQDDPVGDLADELGDAMNAHRRANAFLESATRRAGGSGLPEAAGVPEVDEARSLFFISNRSRDAVLGWWERVREADGTQLAELQRELAGKRWLLIESVWLSRRLDQAAAVTAWADRLTAARIELVRPYHHGRDCIDSGGEGAYPLLFADQAAVMARSIWERDRHRADGILCMSARAAVHFRRVLGDSVPVRAVSELAVSSAPRSRAGRKEG